jgi:hypothetical protein
VLKVAGASVGDASDFAITNTCTAMVPASASCTLSVTLNPAAARAGATCGSTSGAKNTTLSINDNAPGSPQTIALQGSVTDFCADPPGLTTQTITAGTRAAYQMDLVAFAGFSGSVSLACSRENNQNTLIARSRGCAPTGIKAVGGRGGDSSGWPIASVFVRTTARSFEPESITSKISPPGVSREVVGY